LSQGNGVNPILKHDRHLCTLIETIKPHYTQIYRQVPIYSAKHRLIAEIDLIAVKETGVDIFEVKCSFRIHKAKKQLQKLHKLFGTAYHTQQVQYYFYHGEGKQIIQITQNNEKTPC
jgi:hypothetical protein